MHGIVRIMAIVESLMEAPREDVFAVLADGWTYSDWVVGTAHIRAVEHDWPAAGTRLHHKAGPWPFSIRDYTLSVRCEPPKLLVLRPGLRPFGEATVTFTLEEYSPDRTVVGIHEDFERGPLMWLRTKIGDLVLHQRNRESLRRLGDIAFRRSHPGEGHTVHEEAPTSVVREHVS